MGTLKGVFIGAAMLWAAPAVPSCLYMAEGPEVSTVNIANIAETEKEEAQARQRFTAKSGDWKKAALSEKADIAWKKATLGNRFNTGGLMDQPALARGASYKIRTHGVEFHMEGWFPGFTRTVTDMQKIEKKPPAAKPAEAAPRPPKTA